MNVYVFGVLAAEHIVGDIAEPCEGRAILLRAFHAIGGAKLVMFDQVKVNHPRSSSVSFQQIRRGDDEVEETAVLNRLRQLPLVDQGRAL